MSNSWLASAAPGTTDFPLQNLPMGVFRTHRSQEFRGGVAIGDQILDLAALHASGQVTGLAATALEAAIGSTLNPFLALGQEAWSALRAELTKLLGEGGPQDVIEPMLVPQADAEMGLPATVGDYTDFYTSIHHATNIGKLFRPDNPLLPNYRWIPIGYHGRASSVRVSGTDFKRPTGQKRPAEPGQPPGFGPSERVDYELELGIVMGKGNELGSPIPIENAGQHAYGMCLLNDWSARDLQAWEYQPLGPFLAKNFLTSVSPWLVSMEALAPFRLPFTREAGEPEPLPYLDSPDVRSKGALDIELDVLIQTQKMKVFGEEPVRITRGNYKHAYWTLEQLITHHTVSGCDLRPGDLLGTGTLSGPEAGMEGALIEITAGGKKPLTLPNGETRTFLENGDVVILRARCAKDGEVSIGFGEVRGTVRPQ